MTKMIEEGVDVLQESDPVLVPPEPAPMAGPQGHLPKVSDTVIFYPRPGELRAGAGKHAAIVTAVNDDDTLDLVVIFDADDFIGQRRVPMRINGEGMGWVKKPSPTAALEDRIARLERQLLGDLVLADGDSILGILDEHEDRLTAVESAPKPVPAKVPKQAKAKAKPKPRATTAAATPPIA